MKSTIYLVIEYKDFEQKKIKEHCKFDKYGSLKNISDKYDICEKTLSKIITGETKGEKGRSSEFLKNHDIVKVYTKRIKDYNKYIRNMLKDYDSDGEISTSEISACCNWEDECVPYAELM